MTTKERLHKLVDGLSEADAALEFVVSRGGGASPEEAEMLPLPASWQTLPSGRPAPNWVAGLDQVRDANVAVAACAKEHGFTELGVSTLA